MAFIVRTQLCTLYRRMTSISSVKYLSYNWEENPDLDEIREELRDKSRKDLNILLKETHMKLRNSYKKCFNRELVWTSHEEHATDIKRYVVAMHLLATERSATPRKRLIDRTLWNYNSMQKYFNRTVFENSRTESLKKDEKFCTKNKVSSSIISEMVYDLDHLPSRPNEFDTDVRGILPKNTEALNIGPQEESSCKMRVLDVGSCYNPLSIFQDLDVTAIDLQPASKNVYTCDILRLHVSTETKIDKSLSPILQGSKQNAECNFSDDLSTRTIHSLPAAYFDVVVLSLVLSYLPDPVSRFSALQKAYELLKPEGLLLIIDVSRHLDYTWKVTLPALGFEVIYRLRQTPFIYYRAKKGLCKERLQHYAMERANYLRKQFCTKYLLEEQAANLKEKIRSEFDINSALHGLWFTFDLVNVNA